MDFAIVVRMRRVLPLAFAMFLLGLVAPAPAAADRWYVSERMLGVVDAGRIPEAVRQLDPAWDRVLFLWQEIQPNGPNDWRLEEYIRWAGIQQHLKGDTPLLAVVQGTPAWAAGTRRDAAAAVPTGLDLPHRDPRNTFGQFMMRLTRTFKDRITAWMIWNEPDFRPGDAGSWWVWGGNEEDLFKLVRTGYLAVKDVDEEATVLFPATAYYPDAVNGRELFLRRVLREASKLPDAPRHGYYFDAVAVNLYCSPHDIYRVYGLYQSALRQYGLDKPIWLTETNCPVHNDAAAPRDPHASVATHEQAAYVLQAVAMARAAGYQRIGWYTMVDHRPDVISERWGLVRQDGSPRPAFHAFQVAARYLDRPGSARFVPSGALPGGEQWRVWRVVLDDPGARRRVHVLWRSADGPRTVWIGSGGPAAQLVDVLGRTTSLQAENGGWVVHLPPARVPQASDPPGFPAWGAPVLLVERGVLWNIPHGELREVSTAIGSPAYP